MNLRHNILLGLAGFLLLTNCQQEPTMLCEGTDAASANTMIEALQKDMGWPAELSFSYYSGPDINPSPACLAVAADGAVFVGVDMIGSLGKEAGKGSIVKLIDCNQDGVADSHTTFAEVDNPRGILPIGDKVFVLYTQFSATDTTGIATGMDLAVFEDLNRDGVADGAAKPLIQHISSPKFLQGRGTDHATNGIRMGIDGWIYIAVGDFGFHGAVDQSGEKMTMLGGGILRIRPDGTETEIYTHGLRNIYDVAIDPFMNIYTRGNTNDGGGWNIRFAHQIQSGEYGYPVLFKHFTDEIIPALVDVGGGSGTGSLFMDDPNWPEAYNNVPMMADWGRNQLFIHRLTEDGASFKQQEETFIEIPQITDLDVDASGQLFLSAWDGAGYRGDPGKGFVVRAVPNGWTYQPFPELTTQSIKQLTRLLQSGSGVTRLHAQQELITRDQEDVAEAVWEIATDKSLALEVRVAGIFTYAQAAGSAGIDNLVELASDPAVREFALRALSDRKEWADQVPMEPFVAGLEDEAIRVRTAAIIGLGRLGQTEAAEHLLKIPVPASAIAPAFGTEGLHATPNSGIIPAHLAVRALASLNAVEACVEAVGKQHTDIALWALRYMHDERAVTGLIDLYPSIETPSLNPRILNTLARIYQKEAPYDGSWWWSTRPDTRGPFYKPVTWEGSEKIKNFLVEEWRQGNHPSGKSFFAELNSRYRMDIPEFGEVKMAVAEDDEVVDLGRISNKKGEVGKASIEDVMLALAEIDGDVKLGAELFTKQGCNACHSIKKGAPLKGPYMGQIGSIMTRDQIAESILKPNASISQGFASVLLTAKGEKSYVGFVSEETADKIVIRDIGGQVFTVQKTDILEREELEMSMMPRGLANSLTYEEFAALVTYLAGQKG